MTTLRFTDKTCRRCAGTGELKAYSHFMGGECLRCAGTGKEPAGKVWFGVTAVYEGRTFKFVVKSYDVAAALADAAARQVFFAPGNPNAEHNWIHGAHCALTTKPITAQQADRYVARHGDAPKEV